MVAVGQVLQQVWPLHQVRAVREALLVSVAGGLAVAAHLVVMVHFMAPVAADLAALVVVLFSMEVTTLHQKEVLDRDSSIATFNMRATLPLWVLFLNQALRASTQMR